MACRNSGGNFAIQGSSGKVRSPSLESASCWPFALPAIAGQSVDCDDLSVAAVGLLDCSEPERGCMSLAAGEFLSDLVAPAVARLGFGWRDAGS